LAAGEGVLLLNKHTAPPLTPEIERPWCGVRPDEGGSRATVQCYREEGRQAVKRFRREGVDYAIGSHDPFDRQRYGPDPQGVTVTLLNTVPPLLDRPTKRTV
jgi:hypothetical protein